jgi:hypothetical protein
MNRQQEPDSGQYRWYIEPKNEHTNEVLSRDLSDFGHKKARKKGRIKEIPVWEATDYAYVEYTQNSQKDDARLKFEVYTQKKDNDKALLYPWPFDAAKKGHQPRKKKAA